MSIEKLNEIASEIAESKKKLAAFAQTEGRSAIGAAFAPCFEPPTNLVRIEWTAYTPHFNDGDACEYSVHEPDLVTEIDGNEHEHSLDSLSSNQWNAKYHQAAIAEIGEKNARLILKTWDQIPEEVHKAVFGDHVKVVITKDSVEVEEYEHD